MPNFVDCDRTAFRRGLCAALTNWQRVYAPNDRMSDDGRQRARPRPPILAIRRRRISSHKANKIGAPLNPGACDLVS